jgi:type III pantothenate kinase
MKLLVDIGNSRVKWATFADGRLGEQRAAAYEGWTGEDWRREVVGGAGVLRVVAASVASGPAAMLDEAARSVTGRPVTYLATRAEAAGVRVAYGDPRLLGVDRWLALVAAHAMVPGPCCVADVGTAATFDALDAGGRHLGGYIVPGPELMLRALHQRTSDLASHTAASGEAGRAPLADNTRDAIVRGCHLAVAALVDRGVADVEARVGAKATLLVTGGGVSGIRPLIAREAVDVPDLVLRGMALISGEYP